MSNTITLTLDERLTIACACEHAIERLKEKTGSNNPNIPKYQKLRERFELK